MVRWICRWMRMLMDDEWMVSSWWVGGWMVRGLDGFVDGCLSEWMRNGWINRGMDAEWLGVWMTAHSNGTSLSTHFPRFSCSRFSAGSIHLE